MFPNNWQQQQVQANPFPPNSQDGSPSFTGYVRRGAMAGMAAAVGMEGAFLFMLIILRGGLILLGSEETGGILDMIALIFAVMFTAIGAGVGMLAGAIAYALRH